MILACLLLCGCQAITFSVDGLLSAPSIADEQSAIYQALIESAGRGITLEYPRNGDYRSAFILNDVDGDGSDEALAFYSLSSVAESNVKIAVLDRDGDGDWHSMCELAGAGSSVDKVIFSGSDTVVGFASQEYDENSVRMYRYGSGLLESVYEDTYSLLETADLDGCGTEEIALVKRSALGVSVSVLKAGGEAGYESYVCEIDTGASSVAGFAFGKIDGGTALYLDIAGENGGLSSDIFTFGRAGLTSLVFGRGMYSATQRPAGYLSRDYDGDGTVEIPTVGLFTGYGSASWGEAEYLATFLKFNFTTGLFEYGSSAYCNLRDGYIFTIPNRWLNVVTVIRNQSTGEVTFCRYEPEKGDISLMTPIISFASAESSGGDAYTAAGYDILLAEETKNYYFLVRAKPDEPLVLTSDEIRDNFHTID